jgi:hypothetical protein
MNRSNKHPPSFMIVQGFTPPRSAFQPHFPKIQTPNMVIDNRYKPQLLNSGSAENLRLPMLDVDVFTPIND